MDLLDSVIACTVWWALALLIGSVVFKRRKLRPWLERHYKTTYVQPKVQRLQHRQRQLQESLNDPVQLLDIECSMDKEYKGSRKRVLGAMEQSRLMARTQEEDCDARSKGDEKSLAASTILYGAVAIAVSVQAMVPIFGMALYELTENLVSSPVLPTYTECGASALTLQYIFFFFLHLVDSLMIYHEAHEEKWVRFQDKSSSSSYSYSGDLKEVLLAAGA
jgi:hypothetical protein